MLTTCTFFCLLISTAPKAQTAKARLNHIAHYVVNLKISSDFYMNTIGLDTIPDPFHDGKHTWFSIGPKSHLHLIQGAKEASVQPKNSHMCFSVESVTEFTKVLIKNNVDFENLAGEKGAQVEADHRARGGIEEDDRLL